MAPTFTEAAPGWYLLGVTLPDGMRGYQVAFVPDAATGVPASLSLGDTWQQFPGTYLFLAAVPASVPTFLAGLEVFLRAQPDAAAVWLPNPDDPVGAWRATLLSWTRPHGSSGPGVTAGLSVVALRNLALWAGGGAAVALGPGGDALVVTPASPTGTYVTAESGAVALPGLGPLTLSFGDLVAGTIGFGLTLDGTGTAHPPDTDRLDVGLRYFQPTGPTTRGGLPAWQTVSQRYPMLVPPPDSLALAVTLDPLFPTLPARTLWAIPAGTTLASSLLSTTGRPITLTAGAAADYPCGFVPAVRALSVPSRDTDPFYLTPIGAFTVGEANAAGGAPQLMCGGSAVEYLTVPALSGSTLYLVPGQPAYSPGAAPAGGMPRPTPATTAASGRTAAPRASTVGCGGNGGGGGTTGGLTADATTSWAYLVGPAAAAAIYHAQSDAATMYQPVVPAPRTGRTADVDPTLLQYLELTGTTLPAVFDPTGSPPTLFPMVGLAGISGDPSAAQQLELLAISPARRSAIAGLGSAAAAVPVDDSPPGGSGSTPTTRPPLAGATTSATTPQGLYATFDGAAMSLLLGRSQGGAHTLVLGSLQPLLVEAFQSSQLFLVASDEAALGRLATISLDTGRLGIALNSTDTWTFDVFADGWAERGTALVLKFAGRSLLDLLRDTGTWSLAETLNGGDKASVAAVQARLLDVVCDAITRADPAGGNDPDFAPFAALAVDPTWNGVLVLGCAIPLDGLPEQMSGIAVGIDPAKFAAHHLGITVTPVQAPGGVLTPQDSSLFGLVFYDDPADLVGTQADYRFKVNSLTVRFAASAVVSFASRIELLVNALFGDKVMLSGGTHGNNLVLDGVYQRQGTTSAYVFATTGDNLFTTVDSGVLAAVDVAQAQFVTVVPADRAESEHIRAESRFLMAGTLRFHDLDFDLFSYGALADGTPSGQLAFANLSVDLDYDPADPAKSSVYSFDANRLTYDLAASSPRPDSLFDAFPLTLSGFVQAAKPEATSKQPATTPSSLGFLGVDVPLSQGLMQAPWFGVVAELSLGTAGALAAQAGFTASLLAAWAPGSSVNVAVGLKLPGTGGPHKLLSLESVLKLKIADLSLRRVGTTYVLALHDITLGLLSLSFPPSGQTEILLFADPSGQNRTTLGWYGGYAQDPPKPKQSARPRAMPPRTGRAVVGAGRRAVTASSNPVPRVRR